MSKERLVTASSVLPGSCLTRASIPVKKLTTLRCSTMTPLGLPVDPSFPRDRIAYMIEDSKCSVILTEKEMTGELGSVYAKVVTIDTEWDERLSAFALKQRDISLIING